MAASVQNAMENLAEEVRRRDDFVAAFTHEIKTPMTAMLGYADLLRSRDIGQGAREKAADYVLSLIHIWVFLQLWAAGLAYRLHMRAAASPALPGPAARQAAAAAHRAPRLPPAAGPPRSRDKSARPL